MGEVMPLTPEDVSNKRFTPVRLREGYDMGEVDQFLDEVEAELARLIKENDDLREKLARRPGGAVRGQLRAAGSRPQPRRTPEPVEAPEPDAEPAARSGGRRLAGDQGRPPSAEASSAAARLLEIATRNADELVGEAKDEADKIVGEARTKAERLEPRARPRPTGSSRTPAPASQMLDSETAERRTQLFGDLEKEKDRLNTEVENLRAFEREYRSRLKSYFSQQLAGARRQRPRAAGDSPAAGDHAPKRLRSPARRRRGRRPGRSSTPEQRRSRSTLTEAGAPVRATPASRPRSGTRVPAQTRVTVKASPRSSSRCRQLGRRAPRAMRRWRAPRRRPGRACSRSASASSPSACQRQGDPVGDLEAAGLAGLLDQPDHLAGQAGAHAAPG